MKGRSYRTIHSRRSVTVPCSERTDSARGGPAKASKSSSTAAEWWRGGVVDLLAALVPIEGP